MADTKISALPAGAALTGTEAFVAVQSGADVQTTPAALLTYVNANAVLAASQITSGQLALARGGTGADFSATGGANQIVRQNSAGGVLTVSALAAGDIPNLDAGKITSGTLAVARGGTNIGSYTTGDLLYASGATTLAALADAATGNALISGGAGVAPSYGKIGLTTHISGTLAATNGGTGVSNAGTLTNASNTTITGGGTLALGGFTLTVPATGTAALLATANVFTAIQEVDNNGIAATSTDGLILSNTTAAAAGAQQYSPRLRLNGRGWKTNATAGSQTVDFVLENQPVQSTVSPKPSLVISSQANGGSYNPLIYVVQDTTNIPAATDSATFLHSASGTRGLFLNGGMVLCVGGSGTVTAPTSDAGTIVGAGVKLRNSYMYAWSAGTDPGSTLDTALARNAAGVVEVNNGTAGQWGALKAGVRDSGTTTTTNGLTIGHQSTGTPGVGLGAGVLFNLDSSTTADQNAGQIAATWADATHATRSSNLVFYTVTSASALTEQMRLTATGNLTLGNTIRPADGSVSAPGHSFSADTDTGLYRVSANVMAVTGGGVESARLADTSVVAAAAIVDVLTLRRNPASGTPAAGDGPGLLFAGKSTTTTDRSMLEIAVPWATATDASRKARATFNIYDTAAREALRLEASGSAAMIGFLGAGASAQQASGANLTNNVTAGGTTDQIDDFTGAVYATDATTIRNDIYQLARKLKQVNDALRLYGLLT
jgi:hypothetical protein